MGDSMIEDGLERQTNARGAVVDPASNERKRKIVKIVDANIKFLEEKHKTILRKPKLCNASALCVLSDLQYG